MSRVSLDGRWQMRQVGSKAGKVRIAEWTPAAVPGCVHTDLLRARLIPDPYVGRNELDVLWIDQTDWEYRRTFRATARQCRSAMQHLVFEGLDTVAEVLLNGSRVGTADNMFRRWRFDVAGRLRPGENELRVVFRSPIRYGQRQAQRSKSVCRPLEYRNWPGGLTRQTWRPFVRKAQYQFGWDWGPILATSGIWRDCYLLATDEPVLEYVTTQQRHGRGRATVEVTAHVLSPGARRGALRVRLAGQTVAVEARLRKGANRVAARVTIAKPRLWWPAGEGPQPLYPLAAEWLPDGARQASDRHESHIGLRKVELVQRKDASGHSFKFRINDRDVYCKGANWIPDDVFPTRTTRERTHRLLQDAVAANMNMLRVWGGGIYADRELLDLCNELGIMLWHDFMFACAAYPDDRRFLDSVEAEMRHQIRRMANHPSIVLWCGNNENQTAIDSWWATDPRHKRLRTAYDRLTYGLQQRIVAQEDPGRPWVPSSPTGCPRAPGYPFGWERSGDMHNWSVWHRRMDFAHYRGERPRFASEFGFQSFPSVETLRTVAGPADMNVSSPVMEHHQRHTAGNSIIIDFLTREFRFPRDFADFCYLSQVNHGLAMKTAIEHWRRLKPHCMGTLYWQLNDDWPVASWSSIDWCLRWKALHWMARRFYAPLLGSVTDDAAGLRLWATSDAAGPLRGTWRVEAWTYAGRRVWRQERAFRLKAAESRPIARLPKERIIELGGGPEGVFLATQVRAGRLASDNTHLFVPVKRAELAAVRIGTTIRTLRRAQGGGRSYALRLSSNVPAFHVELSTGDLRGHFSDNILALLPRRAVMVRFTPDLPTSAATLRKHLAIRSVRDTY